MTEQAARLNLKREEDVLPSNALVRNIFILNIPPFLLTALIKSRPQSRFFLFWSRGWLKEGEGLYS